MADRFNVKEFNVGFEQARDITKAKIREQEKEKLEELGNVTYQKKITEMSVGEILVGIKNSWFDLVDDLLQKKYTYDTFTKNNRMFFFGLTIIIIIVIIYLYDLFTNSVEPNKKTKTVEVYHIYDKKNSSDDYLSQSERQVVALCDVADLDSI